MNGHIHGKVIGTQQKAGYCQPLFTTIILNIWDTYLYWQNTSEFVLKLKEAPYTDRYVRCCGRSERKLIPFLLSDWLKRICDMRKVFINQFGATLTDMLTSRCLIGKSKSNIFNICFQPCVIVRIITTRFLYFVSHRIISLLRFVQHSDIRTDNDFFI